MCSIGVWKKSVESHADDEGVACEVTEEGLKESFGLYRGHLVF